MATATEVLQTLRAWNIPAFGIPATRVTSAEDLASAVRREQCRTAEDGPRLIEIMVNDALWQ